jgi:hypothetical protein
MSTSTSNVEIHGEPTKNKTPTGFLDLPRELRQCILDYSYESKEVEFSEWYEAYMYVDWANVLREVHHVVAEDVEYIEKRWNKKVVVKGWKSSPNNDVAREIGGESSDTRRERLRRSLCPNTGRANIDDVCYMVCSIT